MPSLQEIFSRSVTQSLGLEDAIRQQEANRGQLAQLGQQQAQLAGANVRKKARGSRGVFETIGSIVGSVGGAVLGGPSGAALGSKIGQGLGGAASGKARQPGTTTGADIVTAGADLIAREEQQRATLKSKKAQQDLENRFKAEELDIKRATASSKAEIDALNKQLKSVEIGLKKKKLTGESKKESRREAGFKGAVDALDKLDSLSDKLFSSRVVPVNQVVNWTRGLLGDVDVSAFETTAILASKQLASVFEGGRLSDKDFEVYRRALPDSNDTFEQRAEKSSTLRGLLEKAINTEKGTHENIPSNLKGDDLQAYDWALSNLNDPRSNAILERLGL